MVIQDTSMGFLSIIRRILILISLLTLKALATKFESISKVFISHLKNILNPPLDPLESTLTHIDTFGRLLDEDDENLMKFLTIEEIEYAIKIASPNKGPGLDGFNAHFFKECWLIIGKDVCDAIQGFLYSGKMLKQLNATFIVLVSKGELANNPDKFRPISLTNEIYKIIGCILMFRLKPLIPKLVGPTPSAFIQGRGITYNILVIQGLLHNFHLHRGVSRLYLKLDFAKACDSVQ